MPSTLDLCCSTFLRGKTSHKDVKDSTNWLFKAYYGHRMFMGYCRVACELLYLILFLIAEKQSGSLVDVVVSAVQQGSPLSFLVELSLFRWAIKQTINVIQLTLYNGIMDPKIGQFEIHLL
ncbi:hypothetical protein CISIN_1g036549mg [Citrus sinensis]|uniref:Uncharacterized protein n=1 Tax=Citrus sinensis TaxID=2711 RepID=A0A067DIC2_CITSI|nr:hypothetical protein CISIN_1g036549mg [Citrus sinensis]